MKPPDRNLDAAYRIAYAKGPQVRATNYFRKWAKDNDWHARVTDYDNRIQDAATEAHLEVVRRNTIDWAERRDSIRDQMYEQAMALLEKIDAMLKFPLSERVIKERDAEGREITTIVKPVRWNLRDVPRMLDVANKVARLSADMETEGAAADLDDINRRRRERAEALMDDPDALAELLELAEIVDGLEVGS